MENKNKKAIDLIDKWVGENNTKQAKAWKKLQKSIEDNKLSYRNRFEKEVGKIYIVYGITGEYDDRRDWNVKAFKTKKAANKFCKECNKYVKGSNLWVYSERGEFKHPLDKDCKIDYNGTQYNISEIDYENQ